MSLQSRSFPYKIVMYGIAVQNKMEEGFLLRMKVACSYILPLFQTMKLLYREDPLVQLLDQILKLKTPNWKEMLQISMEEQCLLKKLHDLCALLPC